VQRGRLDGSFGRGTAQRPTTPVHHVARQIRPRQGRVTARRGSAILRRAVNGFSAGRAWSRVLELEPAPREA